MENLAGDVTVLLRAWGAGDRSVEDRLFNRVVPELRKLAQSLLRGERSGNSVQASSLINEAYLRLVSAREREWQDRRHFYAIAARIMRRLLIDHARGRRGNISIDGFEDLLRGRESQVEQAVAIDALLDQLEKHHPGQCHIIEMRFFLGLTEEETAHALELSVRTVQRQYSDARRWLYQKLEADPCPPKPNATKS